MNNHLHERILYAARERVADLHLLGTWENAIELISLRNQEALHEQAAIEAMGELAKFYKHIEYAGWTYSPTEPNTHEYHKEGYYETESDLYDQWLIERGDG